MTKPVLAVARLFLSGSFPVLFWDGGLGGDLAGREGPAALGLRVKGLGFGVQGLLVVQRI